ncbi:MAG: FecR family protein [Lacunisphaera sp.]|nr:FecR family protein [Lacunisphaera sp.]
MPPDSPIISEQIQEAASTWLSRRDRGLAASEQDDYLEWLYANPQHGRAIIQLERVWVALNKLQEWRPAHSTVPNPDLLAPRRHSRLYWLSTALVAAAAIAMACYVWLPAHTPAPHREAIIHPGPERLVLEDGSIIELNTGAKVDVRFTPVERRVQLLNGEAHFTVAKNPNRPFYVSADKVAVRAVGTAFTVTLGQDDVSVLVTEGKVGVITQPMPPVDLSAGAGVPTALGDAEPSAYLIAGQQALINRAVVTDVLVNEVTPADMERSQSWQGLRLEFIEMPLRDVAATFNRYNRQKLVVTGPDTGEILVGGNFRADNVDGFVRLLEASFGITASAQGDEIILRKEP